MTTGYVVALELRGYEVMHRDTKGDAKMTAKKVSDLLHEAGHWNRIIPAGFDSEYAEGTDPKVVLVGTRVSVSITEYGGMVWADPPADDPNPTWWDWDPTEDPKALLENVNEALRK
ncbi:MAG: hypothetical protein ABH877_04500 [bacterium]